MRRIFTVLTAAFAVVAFSSLVLAQTTPQTEKPKAAAEKTVKAEKAAVAKTEQAAAKTEKVEKAVAKKAPLSASGKVAKYDDATKTVTVTTKKGDENFAVTADTKIMAGTKVVAAADITGKTVKVAFTEADGKMTATKITIAAEKAAPAKTEKKDEPKKEEAKK
ncbi:MAG TPA: hypothetical protein VGK32_14185 [Vicinamibacterales bacterium]